MTQQHIEDIKLETKSVAELKEKMGDAYNDLSVQVAFKEGYNTAIKEAQSKLEQYADKKLDEFVESLFPFEDEDGQTVTGKEDGDYIFVEALLAQLKAFKSKQTEHGTDM